MPVWRVIGRRGRESVCAALLWTPRFWHLSGSVLDNGADLGASLEFDWVGSGTWELEILILILLVGLRIWEVGHLSKNCKEVGQLDSGSVKLFL